MLGVAFGTAALVIVLSVFNGLEGLIRSLYSSFDPELKIESAEGKYFESSTSLLDSVREVPGVDVVSEVIEDNALIRYKDAEMVARIKGVSENFRKQQRLDNVIVHGEATLTKGDINYAILGLGVSHRLSISPKDQFSALQIYYPKHGTVSTTNLTNLYTQKSILPGGIFAIEKQYDEQYIFVPLNFAIALFEYQQRRTSLEIKIAEGYDMIKVQNALNQTLGDQYLITNKDQQHPSLFKAIKIEKLFSLFTFFFILALASLSIFFTLNMLVIEKQKDISVLMALGASGRLIKSIFWFEGAIISLSGAIIGLLLGFTVCIIQINFGIVSMGMQTSVINAYPVKMQFLDFLYTAICVIIITILASYRPASLAAKTSMIPHL
ncbi:MAG: membrane protein [Cyclobacteriaceae bacterium]|nr:MAG: membrane protein [Cyclobacteriaceae bacterium]